MAGEGFGVIIRVVRKSALQHAALLAVLALGCVALLIWPQGAAAGVSRGLAVCGGVIIPSLFPFLVLTGLFVRSGLAGRVGRRLDGVTRRLFGLPGCCGAAVLIGAVGGYPAGAVATRELLHSGEIDEIQARRLLRFCVNAGPAFLIGTVGAGMLGSTWKGVLLYTANVLASFILGLFGRRSAPAETTCRLPRHPKDGAMKIVVESVESACASLLSMCGFVVLFAAFLTLSEVSGLTAFIMRVLAIPFTFTALDPQPLACLYTAFWEVSNGCMSVAGSGLRGMGLFFLLGVAVGWGGVSVHCQIGGIFSETKVVTKGYILARAWHALLGGALSALLIRVVPLPSPTGAAVTAAVVSAVPVQPVSVSVTASVALLLMCGALLFGTAAD